eukprot:GSChrysophyteH1.ASY1.ANO1.2251.1 assembled CDS
MDAAYLKKNVNDALTEALASMAVGMPDDKVEYMGRYLKSYCERKRAQAKLKEEAGEAESKWAAYECENDEKKAALQAKEDEKNAKLDKLTNFLMELENNALTKQDVMDQVTAFTAEYIGVPACYIGTRKTINEVDTLYYYSANDDQKPKVVGQKLTAPTGEGEDDAPQRQGVTFEAFKAPEAPEVEAPEDAPEDWSPPPPPGPQPLVVENCMRDTRCKFYGIPKLGSFLAVPLNFNSSDHAEGIVQGEAPAEEAPPIWIAQKTVAQSLVLCCDTVGRYRAFSKADIDTVKTIGDKLISVFEVIENRQFEGQSAYLDGAEGQAEKVAELVAPLAEEEAAVIAAVNEELNPPAPEAAEGEEPAAVVPPAETLVALKTSVAALKVQTGAFAGADLSALLNGMASHVLPPAAAVTNLLYTASLLCGIGESAKDLYGEITWNNIVTKCIPSLGASMASFDAETVDATVLGDVKAFVEANGVLPGEYPPTCAICTALSQWVSKAIGAADASAAHAAFLAEQEAAAAAAAAGDEQD